MPFQVADDALAWVSGNAEHPSVFFFGGEPTLRWDDIIVPIVEKYPNARFSITTNGSQLNEERLTFIADHGISLMLSMDGDRETQAYNRDKVSFDKLDLLIPTLLECCPNTPFRGTIIPATCSHTLENIIYAQNKGFKSCYFTINIFEEWDEKSRSLLEQAIDGYAYYFAKSFLDNKRIINFTPFTDMIAQILKGEIGVLDNRVNEYKCGLGNGYAAVDYKGDIYTCQEIVTMRDCNEQFRIGNIYTGVNKQAIERMIKVMVNDTEIRCDIPEKCLDCPLKESCKKNTCQINNFLCSKNCLVQSKNQCWWNLLLYKEAYKVISLLQNTPNFQNYMKNIIIGKEEI